MHSASSLGPDHLPDGSAFAFWEQPLQFSRTYYVDGKAPTADDAGPGTREQPFKTISRAAQVLGPGERVVIAGGIYRECVRPERGGDGPDRMISYEAAEGEEVIVKGSQILEGDWQISDEWNLRRTNPKVVGEPRIWKLRFDPDMFRGYNPFGTLNMMPDTTFFSGKNIEPFIRRRGMLFVDDQPLQQVNLPYELTGGDGRFWVEQNGLAIHVRFSGDSAPDAFTIEATTEEQVFVPAHMFLGYIRVKGIAFEHAANGFPVPQRGLVSAGRGHHWIIEDCTIQHANSVGLDVGNECWHRPVPPEEFSQHIIRRNTIRHCGICGLASIWSRQMLVEDNLIEYVGAHHANNVSESAGVKVHHSRDLLFRRNVIRHIDSCPAVWLDYNNVNCRVSSNIMGDVAGHWSFAAMHIEVCRELNMVDNNIIWGVGKGAEPWDWVIDNYVQHETEGNGLNLRGTDNLIVAQNLIGDCDYSAMWPVNTPLRVQHGRGGLMRDIQVCNNIIHRCGEAALHFDNEHNYAEGNLYSGFRSAYLRILNPVPQWLDLPSWQQYHGWDEQGVATDAEITFDIDTLTLRMDLGDAAHPVDVYHGVQSDLQGNATGERRLPGPFSQVEALSTSTCVDPRHK